MLQLCIPTTYSIDDISNHEQSVVRKTNARASMANHVTTRHASFNLRAEARANYSHCEFSQVNYYSVHILFNLSY